MVLQGERVLNNGSYLGLVDLLLLAQSRDKNLVCCCLDNDTPRCMSLVKFVEESLEVKFSDFSADPSVSDKNTWFVICCRADCQRVDFLSLNHFMPACHKLQLGEEMWDKACAASSSANAKAKAHRSHGGSKPRRPYILGNVSPTSVGRPLDQGRTACISGVSEVGCLSRECTCKWQLWIGQYCSYSKTIQSAWARLITLWNNDMHCGKNLVIPGCF